jgi:hypothetical protein
MATGIGIAAATDRSDGAAARAETVSCPTVADTLPAIPAAAQAEVTANLQQLDKQIAEANQRLANTVGQGGPNFVQNAILGPLADKRRATIDRIAIAIGRHAARPTGLDALAVCTLARPASTRWERRSPRRARCPRCAQSPALPPRERPRC